MNIQWNSQSGFTLIELLIAITITGVLAGLSFPAYSGMVRRARYAEAKQQMGTIAKELELYRVETGEFPPDVNRRQKPEGISSWPDQEDIPYESFYDYDHLGIGNNRCHVRIRYAGESRTAAQPRGPEKLGFTEFEDKIILGVASYKCRAGRGSIR